MNIFVFNEFVRGIRGQGFGQSYYNQLIYFLEDLTESKVINEVINDNKYFYPKHLWKEEEKLEIYFLTDNLLVKSTYDSNRHISISTKLLKDISSIKIYDFNASNYAISLELEFSVGEKIVFCSDDSNAHWKHKYYQKIIEIHNFLITRT